MVGSLKKKERSSSREFKLIAFSPLMCDKKGNDHDTTQPQLARAFFPKLGFTLQLDFPTIILMTLITLICQCQEKIG